MTCRSDGYRWLFGKKHRSPHSSASGPPMLAIHAPEEYAALLDVLPDDVSIVTKASAGEGAIVHLCAQGW
jgi:hypothetical protein